MYRWITAALLVIAAVLSLPDRARPAMDTLSADNVVIVLDASGSMSDNMKNTQIRKITAAKKALKTVIGQIPQDTQIGLLVFSAGNLDQDWQFPLGPRNDAALFEAIDRPDPGGKTPLGEYIRRGAEALMAQKKSQYGYGTYRLLVVTDGEATDKTLLDRVVPDVIGRGIILDVIGVDMRKQHTLATSVHSYREANDPESLARAVKAVFAEIGGDDTVNLEQETFDLLEAIPDELAAAMLDSLARPLELPIGNRQPAPATTEPAAGPGKQPPQKKTSDSGNGMSGEMIVVIVIGVFVVFKFLFRGRSRGGRR